MLLVKLGLRGVLGVTAIAACGSSKSSAPSQTRAVASRPAPGAVAQSGDAAMAPDARAAFAVARFVYTKFHFELGMQLWAVDDKGYVIDVFTTHQNVAVKSYCATLTDANRENCAELKRARQASLTQLVTHKATYQLSATDWASGVVMLQRAGFAALAPLYQEHGVDDGVTQTYELATTDGKRWKSSVYEGAGQAGPTELVVVTQWIRAMQAANEAARTQATRVTAEEQKALETQFGARP